MLVLKHNVMGTALYYARGGYQCDLGILLKLMYAEAAAVAHGGLHLAEGEGHIVLEASGIGNKGVHALLEAQLAASAQVISLSVTGSGTAFSPVLLHVASIDIDPLRRALVKAGKVSAQHHKISSHGKGKGHMIVMDYASV